MADPNDTRGAPPREIHIERKPTNWLAWLALLAGILALLLALSRCNRHDEAVAPAPATTATQAAATTPPVGIKHVALPGGKTVEWDARVTADEPNASIAWASEDGADVPNSGTVTFGSVKPLVTSKLTVTMAPMTATTEAGSALPVSWM